MLNRIPEADGLPDGRGKPVKRRAEEKVWGVGMRYEQEQPPLRTWNGQPGLVLREATDGESPERF